jgi:alpha-D-ribose 1-methylphosphonate 5-triphosphate diphosphatase
MADRLLLANTRIVTPTGIVHGTLVANDGRIAAIDPGPTSSAAAQDLDGDYLLPGLIELHTDNLERHLMPRPQVNWPTLPALLAHDAEIAAAGITTVFDALGVGDADESELRGQDMGKVIGAIEYAAAENLLRAEHYVHIRCELPAPNALSLFAPIKDRPVIRMLSLMDHTPGQRQWTDLERARVYWTGKKGWSEAKFRAHVDSAPERQRRFADRHRAHFVDFAQTRRIAAASHDDTTEAHVEQAHADGLSISEFPTSSRAAIHARKLGLTIVMGAPNMVRGGSHSGNVSAMALAKDDLLDSLSSDYVPASLLAAAFMLVEQAGFRLEQAIATVSANPARAVGLGDRGELRPALRADLVRVRVVDGYPVVRSVWRGGRQVS